LAELARANPAQNNRSQLADLGKGAVQTGFDIRDNFFPFAHQQIDCHIADGRAGIRQCIHQQWIGDPLAQAGQDHQRRLADTFDRIAQQRSNPYHGQGGQAVFCGPPGGAAGQRRARHLIYLGFHSQRRFQAHRVGWVAQVIHQAMDGLRLVHFSQYLHTPHTVSRLRLAQKLLQGSGGLRQAIKIRPGGHRDQRPGAYIQIGIIQQAQQTGAVLLVVGVDQLLQPCNGRLAHQPIWVLQQAVIKIARFARPCPRSRQHIHHGCPRPRFPLAANGGCQDVQRLCAADLGDQLRHKHGQLVTGALFQFLLQAVQGGRVGHGQLKTLLRHQEGVIFVFQHFDQGPAVLLAGNVRGNQVAQGHYTDQARHEPGPHGGRQKRQDDQQQQPANQRSKLPYQALYKGARPASQTQGHRIVQQTADGDLEYSPKSRAIEVGGRSAGQAGQKYQTAAYHQVSGREDQAAIRQPNAGNQPAQPKQQRRKHQRVSDTEH